MDSGKPSHNFSNKDSQNYSNVEDSEYFKLSAPPAIANGTSSPEKLEPISDSPKSDVTSLKTSNGLKPDEKSLKEPIDHSDEKFEVYHRRWYILILYSLIAGTQGSVWNTFGPIAETSEFAFCWSDSTIALSTNWGPISYLVAGLVFSWLMEVKGLRVSCLLAIILVSAGTALRCISPDPTAFTWLMHVGQFLNGLAGPIAQGAPPAVSATWFPKEQRATSTAIGTLCNLIGASSSFIIGPLLVMDVSNLTSNGNSCLNESAYKDCFTNSTTLSLSSNCSSSITQEQLNADQARKSIMFYMYVVAGWCAALLVLVIVYFPAKPPLPPCASAAIQREHFIKGIKQLMKNVPFLLIAIVYGLSTGVQACWMGVVDVILRPHQIGQKDAGWIGFYASCVSCVLSLVIARFADLFSRIMKTLIFSAYGFATIIYLLFALVTVDAIPSSRALFYGLIISGNAALAVIPLMFELGCEFAYPTGEGTTNIFLTTMNNISGLVFLFMMMIPNIGSMWTNWVLFGANVVCLPLIFFMKTQYNRLEVDEQNPSKSSIYIEKEILPPKAQLTA